MFMFMQMLMLATVLAERPLPFLQSKRHLAKMFLVNFERATLLGHMSCTDLPSHTQGAVGSRTLPTWGPPGPSGPWLSGGAAPFARRRPGGHCKRRVAVVSGDGLKGPRLVQKAATRRACRAQHSDVHTTIAALQLLPMFMTTEPTRALFSCIATGALAVVAGPLSQCNAALIHITIA